MQYNVKKKFKIFIAFLRVPALDILLSSKSNMLQSAITPPIIISVASLIRNLSFVLNLIRLRKAAKFAIFLA